jgi:hypothetical protein
MKNRADIADGVAMKKVHPELLEQLEQAGNKLVQAVVQLRPAKDSKSAPTPAAALVLAEKVLDRVGQKVGHGAARTNVLRNIATVVVEADSDFVRTLIAQPEVVSALPNLTKQSISIPPKRKRRI